jgi:hypothetical protein
MQSGNADWRTANRSSAEIAPLPQDHPDAVIQIYGARTYGWRGKVAVHTWIATKGKHAENYVVHQVLGWRQRRNLSVVISQNDLPDRYWYGNEPELYVDVRGEDAELILDSVHLAIENYPHSDEYTMFPGPNSNTFTSHVGREVPELRLDLPPTAIGKDFLPGNKIIADATSGTGKQFSLFGLLGITLATEEGLAVNILGLDFGVNPAKLKLRLPVIGILEPGEG